MQRAVEGILPSAAWEKYHRGSHSDVDANVPRVGIVAEFARHRTAAGENAAHVAIGPAIENLDRFFDGFALHDAQDRPKVFRLGDNAAFGRIPEDGRFDEIILS